MSPTTAALPAAAAATVPEEPEDRPRPLRPARVALWLGLAAAAAAAAAWDAHSGALRTFSGVTPPLVWSSLALLGLAFGCEFVDATIGMGYGTTLTPVLLILGYPVKTVVAAALLSQLLANVAVAFFHHQAGNYDFWRDRRARNAGLIMGGVGLGVSAVTMLVAIRIDASLLRLGITVMVIGIGLFMLAAANFKLRFRMGGIAALAGVAAFNKAFSGGGYGPLVAGGQVLVGMPVRAAVATTAIAEALVCVAAVVAYYAAGQRIPLYLVLPLVAGAILSTPLSAFTLRRLPPGLVRRLMGFAIVALGLWALVQRKGV
ncbi:MAG TPA: sulfite exporter TauE/SafE family protein [Polyangia bacterium]|jgi:hypothetical protein